MKKIMTTAMGAAFLMTASPVHAEFIKGSASLGSVSPIVKISRQENDLAQLVEGEVLYIFTEKGEAVAQVVVKNVFSDEVVSEPLPGAVAAQIRASGAILVYSNLREYGDFIRAYLDGSEKVFQDFIALHPRSELREEAERVIDGIVYRPFKLRGTVEAYNEFLGFYPDNFYATAARKRRDALLFAPIRQADRPSLYSAFIAEHPESPFIAEARERREAFRSGYKEVALAELATEPARMLGRKVRFACTLQSALPVYVEGPSVGRKAPGFSSPRNFEDYLNFQVRDGELILWRLFVQRETADLVDRIERMPKLARIAVYGNVFDAVGNAPWIDVSDVEVFPGPSGTKGP